MARRISRREAIRRAALGATVPALVTLLAACGGEDDEPTAPVQASPTGGGASDPTATSAPAEASPTAVAEEPTATSQAAEPTATSEPAGENPRWMGKVIEPAQHEGGVVVEGHVTDLSVPYFGTGGYAFGITEQLLEFHPDTGEPVGVLAESYEINDDATVFTMSIREGVSWHDGKPLTGQDIVSTFTLLALPQMSGSFLGNLDQGEINLLDEMTVEFVLPTGNVDFTTVVTYFSVAPAWIIDQLTQEQIDNYYVDVPPFESGSDPSQVIGTGPFKLERFEPGVAVTVVRNDDYWDGRPHIERFILQVVSGTDALLTQLRSGEVDVAGGTFNSTNLNPASVPDLEGAGLIVQDFPNPLYNYYATNLNPEKTTLFQDVRVRQAMYYAVDRQALADAALLGYADVALGTMSSIFGFDPDLITVRYDYDPDQAMALLDEAGWTAGADGVREQDGRQLAFTVWVRSGDTTLETLATILQEYWRQVGIAVEIGIEQDAAFYERWDETRDFEVMLLSHYSSLTDQIYSYTCQGLEDGGNRVMYCNPDDLTVDELLQAALVETDPAARNQLLAEYQNILMTDLPVGPLVFPRGIAAVNARVHNMYRNGLNTTFNMETWWVDG
jgi:peptide/nickel transport system substrate-binding protein